MKKPEISIAMCTYNGAHFLSEQLESLQHQTELPKELIICDDGSTDKTIDIIEEFTTRARFTVRLFINEYRLGYVNNFIKAASLCQRDLISFCDQDDIWRNDKLSTIVKEFEDPYTLMVFHNARLVRDGTSLGSVYSLGDFPSVSEPAETNPWRFPLGFTETFRREMTIFDNLRIDYLGEDPSKHTAHDQWYFFMSSSLGRVRYINETLADYRQHSGNTFGLARKKNRDNIIFKIDGKLRGYKDYNILHSVCMDRARLLSDVSNKESIFKLYRENSKKSSEFFLDLSYLYELRGLVYSANTIGLRLKKFLLLIKINGYSKSRSAYFSQISLLRDVVQGILLAKLKNKSADTSDFSLIINPSVL